MAWEAKQMSDFPDTHEVSITGTPAATGLNVGHTVGQGGFRIEEAYWGYSVIKLGPAPVALVALQSVSLVAGAAFVAAGFALLWQAEGDVIVRAPLAIICAAMGAVLLWYASRGIQSQIEVDTLRGEVREVARSRFGGGSVIASYGFDCIGSVFISRVPGRPPVLSLRYRDTARQLDVACAEEGDLERLRDRLGRDLILNRGCAV